MSLQAPLRYSCIEFRRVLSTGTSRPLLVVASEPDGGTAQVVLKVREPGVPNGHFGPTSLAAELVCSVLARAAGLTVPDYGIATVSREFAESVPDKPVRDLLLANLGPNFATRYLGGRSTWLPSYTPRGELLDRLEGVLALDCTLINGDRTHRNPNLLWDGDDVVLIDHSLALPVHAWSDEQRQQSPLMPEQHVRRHATYTALANQGRPYQALLDAWAALPWADVATLRSWIPPEWERCPGDLDRMFAFLERRDQRFNDIRHELVRIVR